jgi:hypothetical protein
MAYDHKYGGVIWTKHALERLTERQITQGDAWATWRRPDRSRYAATQGAWVYYKTWGKQTIEVVAKQNDRKEWVVLSVWSKPAQERELVQASWIDKIMGWITGRKEG